MTARLGATPEEWQQFSNHLGLLEDLLPIVANLALPVSPKSSMAPGQVGKIPSVVRDGHVGGIVKWTEHITTPREITRWSADGDLGLCIIGRNVKGFDIDIDDPVLAQRVQDVIELFTGPLPTRWRDNSGKRLLICRCSVELPKWVWTLSLTPKHQVEFLSNKQQFVVAGTHKSGARLQWRGLEDGIPAVDLADIEAAWQAVGEAFGAYGTKGRLSEGDIGERNAADANDPAVDYLLEHGQVRSFHHDGRVNVHCPWVDEHSEGAGGEDSTQYMPSGVGRPEAGFRCLHAHCEHRTVGDFYEATGYLAEQVLNEFEAIPDAVMVVKDAEGELTELPPLPKLKRVKGEIVVTATALNAYLQRPDQTGYALGADKFLNRLMICPADEAGRPSGSWRPFEDEDYEELKLKLEQHKFRVIGDAALRNAVRLAARRLAFDSAQQWLGGLQWDGVPRVDTVMHRLFKTKPGEYTTALGRYLFSALAGRVLAPGCKADMVPILIGKQGMRKSSAVAALAPTPEAFFEINLEKLDDNLSRNMRGKVIGELGELRGLLSRDLESIKQFIVRTHEEFPPKYVEFSARFPRRFIMVGTTNKDEILADPTGERRMLPVRVVGDIDIDQLVAEREQLWAEGAHLFKTQGGVQWEAAERLAKAEHAEFQIADTWDTIIEQYLKAGDMDEADGPSRGERGVSMHELMVSALQLTSREQGRPNALRIGDVMRSLKYEKRDTRKGKLWFPASGLRVTNYC